MTHKMQIRMDPEGVPDISIKFEAVENAEPRLILETTGYETLGEVFGQLADVCMTLKGLMDNSVVTEADSRAAHPAGRKRFNPRKRDQ